jgi:hypothetical protein
MVQKVNIDFVSSFFRPFMKESVGLKSHSNLNACNHIKSTKLQHPFSEHESWDKKN